MRSDFLVWSTAREHLFRCHQCDPGRWLRWAGLGIVAPPFQLLGLARTTPSIHAAEYVLHVLLLAFLLGLWSAQQTLNIQQSHKHIRNLGLTELPLLYGVQARSTHNARCLQPRRNWPASSSVKDQKSPFPRLNSRLHIAVLAFLPADAFEDPMS